MTRPHTAVLAYGARRSHATRARRRVRARTAPATGEIDAVMATGGS